MYKYLLAWGQFGSRDDGEVRRLVGRRREQR
jgi:hypothetical protein